MTLSKKNRKIMKRNGSKNYVFCDCVFLLILGGFREDFGMCLQALGTSWVTFRYRILGLVFRTLSKRALGGFSGLKQTTETTPALSSALSDFEINFKLISKSLSAILSAAQRKMSSRFLFDPFKGRIGNATTFCSEFC